MTNKSTRKEIIGTLNFDDWDKEYHIIVNGDSIDIIEFLEDFDMKKVKITVEECNGK